MDHGGGEAGGADFGAGTALCEPPCADYVAGAALCQPGGSGKQILRRECNGPPNTCFEATALRAVTRVRSPLFVAREPHQHRSACVAVHLHGDAHQMLEEIMLTLKTPPTSRARSSRT